MGIIQVANNKSKMNANITLPIKLFNGAEFY